MTPEQASALRQPFPKSAIGILPKPYKKDSPKGQCRDCGGWHGMPAVHLDYVGHAATTDRLLSVDPGWTWEPLATDPGGLPLPDAQGNLWIRLTVCGVTRIGVGDGSSMKERIGDAIRNAAMRFGVALDLWSKEELEQSHGPAAPPPFSESPQASGPGEHVETTPVEAPGPEQHPETGEAITDRTRKHLFALLGKVGIGDEDDQRAFLSDTLGRRVESRSTLTEAEGVAAGKRLRRIEQGDPEADWHPTFDGSNA